MAVYHVSILKQSVNALYVSGFCLPKNLPKLHMRIAYCMLIFPRTRS